MSCRSGTTGFDGLEYWTCLRTGGYDPRFLVIKNKCGQQNDHVGRMNQSRRSIGAGWSRPGVIIDQVGGGISREKLARARNLEPN
jgi:hypothetical protein